MASRCRTALVEPPVAATDAMAFSKAGRVMMSRGRTLFCQSFITSAPTWSATSSFIASIAGTLFAPMGEIPMNSITVDMVLAVNWPPQAPAPGQATSSSFFKSPSLIRPAAFAPMAS